MEYKYKTKNGTVVRVFYNKFVPVDENHFWYYVMASKGRALKS